MSDEERRRWNDRWTLGAADPPATPHPFVLAQAEHLPRRGLALDMGSGEGRHARLLSARGLRVVAADISRVALRRSRTLAGSARIVHVETDLETFPFAGAAFDAVVAVHWLHRPVIPAMIRALRPGGLLLIVTLAAPEPGPYRLGPGEGRILFAGLRILDIREPGSRAFADFALAGRAGS